MHSHYLDQYSRIASPIHRLPAGMKLTVAVGLVIAMVLLPRHLAPLLGIPALVLVVVAALSRLPVGFLLRRILFLEPFVLGVAILALFQPQGFPLFLMLIIRCTLCLITMILLSNTTPFSELLRVLKLVHVPSLMITTLALMYRYLFVLSDESLRMRRARASRTFTPGRIGRWRALSTVIGQLFLRASERAERIYDAMCARGWQS